MKNYFIIIDTETTQDAKVADFGAVVVDSKGKIHAQCAVLINGIYTDTENHPLFFTSDKDGIWSKDGQDKRYSTYTAMLEGGSRMLASVGAVNRWLDRVRDKYNPILTAYNLAFDLDKCRNTGIDLTGFSKSFCLWAAAFTQWGKSRKYLEFALSCHAFNAPTQFGNMTFKTNAETMARFVLGNPELPNEPHTALEDIVFYELPIFCALTKARSAKWLLNETRPYNWRECQVRDYFKAR